MTLQLDGTIVAMAVSRERRRRLVSAFATGGATWTAASAGFVEPPSLSQLIMLGLAAVLTGTVVAFGPEAFVQSSDSKKKPRYCKLHTQSGPFAWLQVVSGLSPALKKTSKVRLGM
ncbi:hypothetical protein ACLQ26_13915 [Micromonospora sp. DT43]|uniref:hypothetical protein n=1 Tax=Micromonospora sp. DT43 TaxID=3393440 RepID=UPI003CEDC2DC